MTARWLMVGRLTALVVAGLLLRAGAAWGASPAPSQVTLVLRNTSSVPVPVPRVPGTTAVRVPVYAGAQPAAVPFSSKDEVEIPGTPYLRAAGKAFRLPHGTSGDRVLAWYATQMKQRGYVENQSGNGGGPEGPTFVMAGFAPRGWQHLAHPVELTVIVRFTGPSLRLALWATQDMTPPRPRDSYLPADITLVRGEVVHYGTSVQKESVRITNPKAIRRLRQALNELKHISAGIHSCPSVFETGHLTFSFRTGRPVSVTFAIRCDITIGRVPLMDDGKVGPALNWALAHARSR